jgi:hypothetical protein
MLHLHLSSGMFGVSETDPTEGGVYPRAGKQLLFTFRRLVLFVGDEVASVAEPLARRKRLRWSRARWGSLVGACSASTLLERMKAATTRARWQSFILVEGVSGGSRCSRGHSSTCIGRRMKVSCVDRSRNQKLRRCGMPGLGDCQ